MNIDGITVPRNFHQWNPAMRGAYCKGYAAGFAGEPDTACPYDDKRKDCGRLTWSRAFIACWRDGWKQGDDERMRALITDYYSNKAQPGQPPPRA